MLIVEQEHIMEINNLMKITKRLVYIQNWSLWDNSGQTVKLLSQLKKTKLHYLSKTSLAILMNQFTVT